MKVHTVVPCRLLFARIYKTCEEQTIKNENLGNKIANLFRRRYVLEFEWKTTDKINQKLEELLEIGENFLLNRLFGYFLQSYSIICFEISHFYAISSLSIMLIF